MPAAPEQYQVRYKNGCVYTIMAHSVRGAANNFVYGTKTTPGYNVQKGDIFKVRKRLGGAAWTVYTRTKNGIRQIGEEA